MTDDYMADVIGPYVREDGHMAVDRFEPICDFCNGNPKELPIEWSYDARPMTIDLGGLISASDDAWGACQKCHELIEARDWPALADRCIEIQTIRFGVAVPEEFKATLIEHFQKFDAHRIGEAIPEDEFDPRTGKRKEGL